MLRRLLGCSRRYRSSRADSVSVLTRWTAVLPHLRRLRRLQRLTLLGSAGAYAGSEPLYPWTSDRRARYP
eukprot:4084368-Heterocapsa_arctica.AAC.1